MKKLIMLSFVLLAFSMQVEAATLALSAVSNSSVTTSSGDTVSGIGSFSPTTSSSWTLSSSAAQTVYFDFDPTTNSPWIAPEAIYTLTIDSVGYSIPFLSSLPLAITLGLGNHAISVLANGLTTGSSYTMTMIATPIPAAIWLFGSALMGLVGFSCRKSGSAVAV